MQKLLDWSRVPKELQWMMTVIQKDAVPDTQELKSFDWKDIQTLAIHHRLYPILQQRWAGILLPKAIALSFSREYERNTFRMLRYRAEMEQLAACFDAHSTKALFLKGPHLGEYLYGDLSLRTSADIDVLIPLQQLETTEQLLLEQGYVKHEYIDSVLGDWKWRHHHFSYFHPERHIKLELHWRLHPGPGKEPRFSDLWERKQACDKNSRAWMLGKEDLFLFLIMHGARHGWSRLRWLVDIHQLLQKDLDWRQLEQRMKYNHYRPAVAQALILHGDIFGFTYAEPYFKLYPVHSKTIALAQQTVFYLEQMVHLHRLPLEKSIALHHQRNIASLRTFPMKILFASSQLFPYPADVVTFPLPQQLHLLYFPLRPFLIIWRKRKRRTKGRGEMHEVMGSMEQEGS